MVITGSTLQHIGVNVAVTGSTWILLEKVATYTP